MRQQSYYRSVSNIYTSPLDFGMFVVSFFFFFILSKFSFSYSILCLDFLFFFFHVPTPHPPPPKHTHKQLPKHDIPQNLDPLLAFLGGVPDTQEALSQCSL